MLPGTPRTQELNTSLVELLAEAQKAFEAREQQESLRGAAGAFVQNDPWQRDGIDPWANSSNQSLLEMQGKMRSTGAGGLALRERENSTAVSPWKTWQSYRHPTPDPVAAGTGPQYHQIYPPGGKSMPGSQEPPFGKGMESLPPRGFEYPDRSWGNAYTRIPPHDQQHGPQSGPPGGGFAGKGSPEPIPGGRYREEGTQAYGIPACGPGKRPSQGATATSAGSFLTAGGG